MRITAISEGGGSRPSALSLEQYLAYRDMLGSLSTETGPVLRASSFLGSGEAAGGCYAGHAEIYDLDGLLRDMYQQPSMEPGVNNTLFGGGKGTRLQDTLLSTLGEAVERAVAAIVGCSPYLPSRRVLASYSELGDQGVDAVDPASLGLFSEDQYNSEGFLYERFGRDTTVQWVVGKRMGTGKAVYVPSQLVDMVHIYEPGEEIIGYPVSGGLSCHTSTEAATYHGLTEVIERDAVNVSWYTTAPPLRVRLSPEVRAVLGPFVDRLVADHTEGWILFHPSDLCRALTFSVVGIQDWLQRRKYCAGGGCDVVPSASLRKAAVEFGQSRSTLAMSLVAPRSAVGRSVVDMFDWEPDRPLAEMELFFQAIGYYGLSENLVHLDHYLSGQEVEYGDLVSNGMGLAPEAPVSDRLANLLDDLAQHAVDPIVLDYSHPSWHQLAVVKVYVPELSTPFLQSRPMLGHPRLSPLRPELRTPEGRILPLPYP